MEVTAARSAGFCFGVARAVRIAEELARAAEKPRMLGSVIHNRRVMEELAGLGMTEITAPEEAGEGERVLLRAHGVAGRSTTACGPGGRRSWTPPVPGWPTSSAWRPRRRRRAAGR